MTSLSIPSVQTALVQLLDACETSSDRRSEFVRAVADAQAAVAQDQADRYAAQLCHHCAGTGEDVGERACWACRGRGSI